MKNRIIGDKEYYLALFLNKNYALHVSVILEKMGHKSFELIATPQKVSHSCNYGLKFKNLNDLEVLKNISSQYKRPIQKLFHIERIKGDYTIKKIDIKT